jgi:hypothetical protein
MPLSINPSVTQISSDTSSISLVTNEGISLISSEVSSISKQQLDQTIAAASGAIGTGLNGATSGILSGFTNFADGPGVFNSITDAASAGAQSLSNIAGSLSSLAGGSLGAGLTGIAGAISSGASSLNNVLGLFKNVNIPAGAEWVSEQGPGISLSSGNTSDWRVKIQAPWGLFESNLFEMLKETGGVVFPYLPNITVSTKANYTNVETIHSNYPYYAYKNSTVEAIQIAGEFSAETEYDAAYWIAATTFFKTATKMFFGQGANAGHPPIICNLTGYGASVFDKVPIIVTDFSVDLKDDVNYIRCNKFGTNTWVPVLSTVSVTVMPIYSRESLRKFDLKKYASGKMISSGGIGYI